MTCSLFSGQHASLVGTMPPAAACGACKARRLSAPPSTLPIATPMVVKASNEAPQRRGLGETLSAATATRDAKALEGGAGHASCGACRAAAMNSTPSAAQAMQEAAMNFEGLFRSEEHTS